MKKIIALFAFVLFYLFTNAKDFNHNNHFIPIDLERTYLVSKCSKCNDFIAIDYLLYSPKAQYYYYPSGEICSLESLKCNNCKTLEKTQGKKILNFFLVIFSVIAILALISLF